MPGSTVIEPVNPRITRARLDFLRDSSPEGGRRDGRWQCEAPEGVDNPRTPGLAGVPSERGLSSFVSVVLVLLAGFFAYVLVQMWPPSVPAGGTVPATSRFNLFAIKFTLSQDKDFLILLAAAGALGAMAHVLRSFYVYAGEWKLVKSWLISYFLIPEVGAIVAVVVYIVLRGGLIAGGVAQQNPFGFAAVGVLVGMFSSQALEMLKKVFETLFAATPPKSEHYQDLPPSVSSFDPPSGPTQSKVTISGSNLSDTNAVKFGSVDAVAFDVESDSLITASVPEGGTGPITVSTPAGSFTTTDSFTVTNRRP